MLTYRKFLGTTLMLLLSVSAVWGQYADEYTGGLKVKLNETGSKYIRFITWHQVWSTTQLSNNQDANFEPSTDFLLRRSRFLAFAQINKRFLILTHFGLNSLGGGNLGTASPSNENGSNGTFFMHDAWGEYTVLPGKLYVGGGLHYWNGISRLTNQSTLNFLTLDAPIHNWATIGTTDQFARHLGFYAKGKLGKLDFRFAVNEALNNPTRGRSFESLSVMDSSGEASRIINQAAYRNPDRPGGGMVLAGYVNYQFLDKEGNTLPYFVGTYLGGKKVFNIGAGFLHHREGAVYYDDANAAVNDYQVISPTSFSADVFYDAPVGSTLAVTAYGSYTRHSWGPNWTGGVGRVGTGDILYAQAGLALPKMEKLGRLQPYVHFTNRSLEAHENYATPNSTSMGIGANWFLDGHNSKITLEYQRNQFEVELGDAKVTSFLRLQMMVLL